ncbi:MAG: hypothetical protein LBU76_01920 [Azoarcus sp.]|jgi:hypothetical protein|nr:hypothetical protein [Azoarcus sp.]
MNEEVQSEIAKSGLKAAPPVTVSLWEAVAGHINEIVLVLTLIYTVLMIAHQ